MRQLHHQRRRRRRLSPAPHSAPASLGGRGSAEGAPRSLRLALAALGPRERALAVVGACVHFLERLALAATAYELVHVGGARALALAVPLAALYGVRAALRSTLRVRARTGLLGLAVDALLHGDVLSASALPDQDAQSAVLDGVYAAEMFLAEQLPDLAGDVAASLVLVAVVVLTQPVRIIAIGSLTLICAGGAVAVARRFAGDAAERGWEAGMPVIEGLITSIVGRAELVASGREEEFVKDLREKAARWQRIAAKGDRVAALAGRAPTLAAALVVGTALLFDQALRGTLTSAALADAALFASAVPAFAGAARGALDVARTNARFKALASLLVAKRDAPASSKGLPVPRLPARVRWDDVRFTYARPEGAEVPPALSGLTIDWAPGAVLVLSGPNGCGKSTALRLLLGLARPSHGAIRIGDVDVRDIDLVAWRRSIAYLPQRPYLQERATIREAIHLTAPDAGDETMREALARVGLWETLVAKSEDAPLETRVGSLSTGERQRVALARVLSQDARVLLLDEPDANLDAQGIALVGAILRDLAKARMVAVVAHTEAIVAIGDVVVALIVPRSAGSAR